MKTNKINSITCYKLKIFVKNSEFIDFVHVIFSHITVTYVQPFQRM